MDHLPLIVKFFANAEIVGLTLVQRAEIFETNLPEIDGEAASKNASTASRPLSWATALLSMTNFLSIPKYLLNSLLLSSSIRL